MKLNDPFGRVARRDRARYSALKDRLQQANILDARALQGFIDNVTATMLRLLAVILAAAMVLALLFPEASGLIMLLAALVLLWLAVSYVQTRLYLRRYRREECHRGQPESTATGGHTDR